MESSKLAVVGLGYVGLPLGVALARHFPVVGFDIDAARIAEIRQGDDRTREIAPEVLRSSSLRATADPAAIAGMDAYIVTVPTPVDERNEPDLGAVLSACATVGAAMKPGAIVVFESTVYPGVTEEICGPALARASGLACGKDFHLGYSPERINPGDREHTVERITKVVAGQTLEIAARLKAIYGAVNGGNIFVARDIKTAEAAKVIENTQRDINIAFVNEMSLIFQRLGISAYDVLDAARTKWNFLPFVPGLVGGHCIGVDPFYLAHCASAVGVEPQMILAGRRTNDAMSGQIAALVAEKMRAIPGKGPGKRVLVLGLAFKENVPDLRNSKVVDLVECLRRHGHAVDVHDSQANVAEAKQHYGIDLISSLAGCAGYDAVIGAVAHAGYRDLAPDGLRTIVRPGGLIADVKAIWRGRPLPPDRDYWTL